MQMDNVPVFSLISHRTLKRVGFILWQFKACFLLWKARDRETEMGNYKAFSGSRLHILLVTGADTHQQELV